MTNSPEQTATATGTNTRSSGNNKANEDPVSALSATRKEAELAKKSRPKDNSISKPNHASVKMAKRLEPISDLLESLPKPLSKQTSEFATKLLSKAIDVRHCEKKVTFHNNNPAILPTPIKFKFKLTCKSNYEENSIFKVEAARSAIIMDETCQSLRECIVRVMEMEYSGAIINLQKCFIEGILELLSYWICYHKGCYPENVLLLATMKGPKHFYKCTSNPPHQKSLSTSEQIRPLSLKK